MAAACGPVPPPVDPLRPDVLHFTPPSPTVNDEQPSIAARAVTDGLGIGFLDHAAPDPGLIALFPDTAPAEWLTSVWLVTHVDLHRSNKVGSFARFIQAEARHWGEATHPGGD